MALSNELQNLITREAAAARQWHKEIAPGVTDADVLLNGANNWLAGLTQEAIDEVPSFKAANLQRSEVLAVLYQLKLMAAIPAANDIAAFIKLANLG